MTELAHSRPYKVLRCGNTFTAKAAPFEIYGNIVRRMTFVGMQELTLASSRATVAVNTARVY